VAAARRWPGVARGTAGLTTGVFVLFVVAQSPHLVHHPFHDDGAHERVDCPFALAAERIPGVAPDVVVMLSPPTLAGSVSVTVPAPVLPRVPPATTARAPPPTPA
jgi:hypothetical protein